MCNPNFFQNCGICCCCCIEKYHNFERNKDCATAFLKWMEFGPTKSCQLKIVKNTLEVLKNQMRFHKKFGQIVFHLLDVVSYYPIRKGRFPLISTGIKNDMRPHLLGITKVLPSSGYFTHKLPTQIEWNPPTFISP